jgi:hypothetical protein
MRGTRTRPQDRDVMQEEPDRGLLEVPEIDRWPGNEPVSDSHDEQAVDA